MESVVQLRICESAKIDLKKKVKLLFFSLSLRRKLFRFGEIELTENYSDRRWCAPIKIHGGKEKI